MEFRCGGVRCLILNAYRSPMKGSANDGIKRAHSLLSPEQIAPVLVQLPVKTLPDPFVLDAFLKKLSISNLDALKQNASSLADGVNRASDVALWSMLVREIVERTEFTIGGARVRSSEVNDHLQRAYAGQGYPSDEPAILPHLVRGVLAVFDGGEVVDSVRILEFGSVEYGVPRTADVVFANLGSRPLHVYSSGGLLSGARLGDADFALAPGARVNRRLRYETSMVSLLTGRGTAIVAYESGGKRHVVLHLEGDANPSVLSIAASIARMPTADHAEYWYKLPLYRFALLLVGFGAAVLLVFFGYRAVPAAAARTWRLASGLPRALFDVSKRTGDLAAQATGRVRALWSQHNWSGAWFSGRYFRSVLSQSPLSKPHFRSVISLSRLSKLHFRSALSLSRLSEHAESLSEQFRRRIPSGVVSGGLRAATRVRTLLPQSLDARNRNMEPVNGRACVDRVKELSTDGCIPGNHSSSPPVRASELHREVRHLARRLEADLRDGRVPPKIENFQVLWALRSLATVLKAKNADTRGVLVQWLQGAELVLEGAGPNYLTSIDLPRVPEQ